MNIQTIIPKSIRRRSAPPIAVTLFAVLAATSFFSTGCDNSKSDAKPAASAKAAATPAAVEAPIAPDQMIPTGEKLYGQYCIACHGPTADGKVGIAPKLKSKTFLAAASDEMLKTTIRDGRAGTTMTPWGSVLPGQKLDAVIAYLRSLTPHEPVKLDESPVKGDIAAGEKTFQDICARCHGRTGAGYQESSSGTGIGRKAFLAAATDGYLRYMIKNGKSETAMRAFSKKSPTAVANLTDQEIENVIAYLRKAAW